MTLIDAIPSGRAAVPALVSAILAITACGCSKPLTLAVGPAGDISIITDLPEDSPEVRALVDGLEVEIVIIRPEVAFNVEVSDFKGFDIRRNWRNLVLLGSLDEGSRASDAIEGLLGESDRAELERGQRNLFLIRDRWAIGQLIAVIATPDRGSLLEAVRGDTRTLYNAFERATVENTYRILLKKDLQRDTARYLKRTYGWSILVPEAFEVSEDAENRIVLFRAEDPARMILVHWIDGYHKPLTPEDCLDLRAKLAWNVYDEDVIAPDMTETEETSFLGRPAIKIVGVWQNEKHINGGPFRTYCFLDGGRLYLVDLLVYAPGMDKIPFLRELEAICRTFSTR
jgi:hypothetical protein